MQLRTGLTLKSVSGKERTDFPQNKRFLEKLHWMPILINLNITEFLLEI
jgi:hypothetical protein